MSPLSMGGSHVADEKVQEQTTMVAPAAAEKALWAIPEIAGLLVWLETLLVTVSSLMLTFVAVLTVASALNGGRLLESSPFLNQAYAWCQGLGIEGQLSGMTFQAVRAAKRGHGGQAFGYWSVTALLAFASFIAIGAVNYQESFNVSFADALQTVGISQFLWVWLRAGVLVILLILAAAMRYQPTVPESADEKIRKIQEAARIREAQTQAFKGGLAGIRGALTARGGNDAPAPLS